MYNIAGSYYIFVTRPFSGQYILKSSSGPFGPYECRQVLGEILSPVPGAGSPHQGGLVDTPDGQWYYMAFMDAYPCGRTPILAPVTFNEEGWPEVDADYTKPPGLWRPQYPGCSHEKQDDQNSGCFRTHSFGKKGLDLCWQWNQNPDNTKWSLEDESLILHTGTVTDNMYLATNTLTHRTIGPRSMATFCLDISGLKEGDRAGATMLRFNSAYIGIHQDSGTARLVYVDELTMVPFTSPVGFSNGHPVSLDWKMEGAGLIKAETTLTSKRVWLRVKVDVRPAHTHGYEKETRYATFEFSSDGEDFTQLGPKFALCADSMGWLGYRFGLFNFATHALGGHVRLESCDISSWTD